MARLLALVVTSLLLIGCDNAPPNDQSNNTQHANTATATNDAEATAPKIVSDDDSELERPADAIEVEVLVLNETMTVFPTVFDPRTESPRDVLPFMTAHRFLFEGKRVLEIGTGSGVISLYAAKLGASSIIATDINAMAVQCARFNAKKLGHDDVMEVRLVSESDSTAFAVIGDDERFDIIISNPPYALVLDESIRAGKEVADRGDLGFSIIEGLDKHLNPGGVAALLYQSMFYQQVMIQYAQQRGFDVKYHLAYWLAPWEMEALFEAYTANFLEYKSLPEDFITFDHKKDAWGKANVRIVAREYPPLIRGGISDPYPGFIIIKAKQ